MFRFRTLRDRAARPRVLRHPSPRGRTATLVVAALGAAVLVAGGAAGADTAPAPPPAQSSTNAVGPACAAPAPGQATCLALVHVNAKGIPVTTITPTGYTPADLQAAYGLTGAAATDGAGQTVAIVDAYDDPNAESDLAVYRAQYGLPACTTANGCFRKVNQRGDASPLPAADSGWALEESLDVQMVSAICPKCHILLVEADDPDNAELFAAEDTAARLGANAVSNSWGEAEYTGETQDESHFHHKGVAVVVAAGDMGSLLSFPAASRWVTSVGGTALWDGPHGWQESAWYDGGGGCSTQEPKPAWQTDGPCTHRTVADVAADADPYTGVAVYDTTGAGGWLVIGGTSAATPMIASVYALAGNAASIDAPAYPYAHRGDLHDVTQGTNGSGCYPTYLCAAARGYDSPTGLGTPDGIGAF